MSDRHTTDPSHTLPKDSHHKCRHHANQFRVAERKKKREERARREAEEANRPPPSRMSQIVHNYVFPLSWTIVQGIGLAFATLYANYLWGRYVTQQIPPGQWIAPPQLHKKTETTDGHTGTTTTVTQTIQPNTGSPAENRALETAANVSGALAAGVIPSPPAIPPPPSAPSS